MDAINKFFVAIHKANKQFVMEAWDKWQVYIEEVLKAEVDAKYPDGFKDFLSEKLDEEIIKAGAKPKK